MVLCKVLFFQFCDIEKLAIFSIKLPKLVEFTLEILFFGEGEGEILYEP
jgi:hypothetical protein